MSWTISPDTGSFRFLKRYNGVFKKSIEYYHSTNGLQNYYKLPTTFCAYYIKVIWTIFYMSLAAWVVLSIPLALWMLFAGLIINYKGEAVSLMSLVFSPTLLVLIVAIVALVMAGVSFVLSILRDKIRYVVRKFSSTSETEPKPSVVKTWMKARKNKYCPLIEYKL